MSEKAPEPKVELTKEALVALVEEIKKPYVDPRQAAEKERERQEMSAEFRRSKEAEKARWDACSHLREDNTSAIAWLTNSDNIRRGVCQRCNCTITPENPKYIELIRVPTRGQSVIYV